ncbi:MAG: cytochrome c oxidase subunit 3 [Cytophagales bacterium]|nr:cytochrome c oxidase subunit 3 [Cytophagales bacterium]
MSSDNHATPYYFVPEPSPHPVMAAFGLFWVIFGAGQWINGVSWGKWSLFAGLLFLFYVLFRWFGDAIRESVDGKYGYKIDLSFRWSMSWFIFSEVMFFGAFFSALWWMRVHSVPMLANADHALLWEGFKGVWPSLQHGATASPAGIIEAFETMKPVGAASEEVWKASWLAGMWGYISHSLPTVNTALLLTSGVTLTIAHHALIEGNRSKTIKFMWVTVALGLLFLFVQGYEYYHAYHEMNLTLASGAYGSTFFMLTGFHGFHVFIGMLMLLFITLRLQKGHFSANSHFGFEGAAWYWHFVDVVWLGLYILVYWM